VLFVGSEIVGGQEDGAHAAMAILHLVAEREAVHRLQEDLRDHEVDRVGLRNRQRLVARLDGEDVVTRGLLEDRQCGAHILFPIHNENVHRGLGFTYPAESTAVGRF
jgi:hypothetical protein